MTKTDNGSDSPKPRPEDVASPEAIVRAMYDTLSGPAGERNWYRLRSLFVNGARVVPMAGRAGAGEGSPALSLAEWIEQVTPYLADNDFYEAEIMNHADRFGSIMQVFSTYETRRDPGETAFARGINSIQLLFHDGRWWIVSVIWDQESKENPIPGEFMPYLW